jgi:Spy/CpxP family protein refolding chaperone
VLDRLTSELGVSTAQQAQLKPLLDSTHTQVLAIRNDTTLPPEQKFAKIKETLQTARTQISSVLTPAQQQQLQAMKAKWRDHGPRGGAPSASPSPSTTSTNS